MGYLISVIIIIIIYNTTFIILIINNKSDLLCHVVKHEITEKLINKCIYFLRGLPQSSYSRYVRFS